MNLTQPLPAARTGTATGSRANKGQIARRLLALDCFRLTRCTRLSMVLRVFPQTSKYIARALQHNTEGDTDTHNEACVK